jgi:hypothetical protein
MTWIVWFLRPKLCLAPSRRSPCAIKDVCWGTAYRFENRSSWPCNPLWSTLGRFEGKKIRDFHSLSHLVEPASHPPTGTCDTGATPWGANPQDSRLTEGYDDPCWMLRRCWGYHGSWLPTCTMSRCLHCKQRAAMFPWWEQKKLPLFETHVKNNAYKLIEA